jgi:hypothetical protein
MSVTTFEEELFTGRAAELEQVQELLLTTPWNKPVPMIKCE